MNVTVELLINIVTWSMVVLLFLRAGKIVYSAMAPYEPDVSPSIQPSSVDMTRELVDHFESQSQMSDQLIRERQVIQRRTGECRYCGMPPDGPICTHCGAPTDNTYMRDPRLVAPEYTIRN